MTIPATDPPASAKAEHGGVVVGRVAETEDLEDPSSASLPVAQEVVTPSAAKPPEQAPPVTASSSSPATTPAFSLALDGASYDAGALGATPQDHSEGSRSAALKFILTCAVVVVVVLVVVLKVFGMLGRHNNTSTGSGYRSPSSQGYILTLKECPVQYEAFNNCVDPIYGGAVCEACVTAYWPLGEEINNCKQIDNATCVGLANCPTCQGCDALVIDFLDCYTNRICTFDCPANASLYAPLNSSMLDVLYDDDSYNYPASTPTSAPDLETSCPLARELFVSCMTSWSLDASKCFTDHSFLGYGCGDTFRGLCQRLQLCGGLPCDREYWQFVNCDLTYPSCVFDSCSDDLTSDPPAPAATTPSPSASDTGLCQDDYGVLDQCMAEIGLNVASCQSCVSLYTPATMGNCSDATEWTCPALETCGCQKCDTAYLQYSNCLRGWSCGDNVSCPVGDALTPAPTSRRSNVTWSPPTSAIHNVSYYSPTATPVMLPASCTEEATAFDTFLIDHGYNATRCKICIGTVNDPTIFATCQDAQDATCRNVGFCACSATYMNGTTLALEYASCRYAHLGCGAFSCQ